MKLHIVTIGKPKLEYAKLGWQEYLKRLRRYHTVKVTQLDDKYALNTKKLREAVKGQYTVALAIEGKQLSSHQLSAFIQKQELQSHEVAFVIGGPNGLPAEFIYGANYVWSFSELTFPHDLAMVVLLETLYRASTINNGTPYHR
jgi:23S rRNA (pseudouridine1915-N3)-methyltransferase